MESERLQKNNGCTVIETGTHLIVTMIEIKDCISRKISYRINKERLKGEPLNNPIHIFNLINTKF